MERSESPGLIMTQGDNSQLFFWNVGAEYELESVSDTSVGINYSRSIDDVSTSGTSKHSRGDLFFKTGNTRILTVNPYFVNATFINVDRKDKLKGINIDILQPVTNKVTLSLSGLWEDQKFLPEDEKVQRYSLGCGLEYDFNSKITSEIGYRHNVRDSNIATEDFNNNIVWLQARANF